MGVEYLLDAGYHSFTESVGIMFVEQQARRRSIIFLHVGGVLFICGGCLHFFLRLCFPALHSVGLGVESHLEAEQTLSRSSFSDFDPNLAITNGRHYFALAFGFDFRYAGF